MGSSRAPCHDEVMLVAPLIQPSFRRVTRAAAVFGVVAGVLGVGVIGVGLTGTGGLPASAQIGTPKPVVVTLKNLAFKPNKLEIVAGTRVDFTWRDKQSHNVVFSKTDKSKNMSSGVYSKTFSVKGFFKYKCTLHPGMRGEITVK